LQLDTKNDVAKLFVPNSKRDDSGTYTLKAHNEHGDTKADFIVAVVDKPGPPQGPVLYPQINTDSVTLTWRPPMDDGGGEISSMFSHLLLFEC
jgi:titin